MKNFFFNLPSLLMVAFIGVGVMIVNQVVLYMIQSGFGVHVWSFMLTGLLIGTGCYCYNRFLRTTRCLKERSGSAADPTEKTRREEMEQTEKLRMAGTLAAGIAHEIRNPLTSLKGFLQLSAQKESPYTEIMLSEIERIHSIVNELLELASPKESEYQPHYLQPLLSSVITLLQPQSMLNNIQLMGHYTKKTGSLIVHCNESKLKQAFIHLIKNAIEAMPSGGSIVISLTSREGFAWVEIEDEGPGMTKEQIGRMGEAFFTTQKHGTGLGLMISQRIIQDHNGTLTFRNSWNGGTVATVRLPIRLEHGGI